MDTKPIANKPGTAAAPALFEPLPIRSVTIPNRIVVSPMCEYSSDDGFANDWHLVHLGSRAVGGAGLVIAEATAVSPEGRITYGDLGIWKDEHIPFLQRITTFVKSQGSIPGIQIAHAGRKASCEVPWKGGTPLAADHPCGWQTVGPSPIPFNRQSQTPRELTQADLVHLVDCFSAATRRALAAGFEVIEVHAAHGYLLHEFLSPLSNQRTDAYGGSLANRARLLLQVVQAVREQMRPQLPLFVRISATDWVAGGWDIEQSVQVARWLKPLGVDLIDCSSGGNVGHARIPVGPGYQVEFARRIRHEAHMLTGAVGMITDPQQAEAILRNGDADLILLAREFLRNPYFPMQAAQDLGVPAEVPKQYLRAIKDSVSRDRD
ncbi:MAG: NADH:flavin oxidoreductase/NADH oxidase [Bryobacterales bacterium]|nr:NADH:flavin oxidoreductase/NADH oxidase [Bryobacterales bacterium]